MAQQICWFFGLKKVKNRDENVQNDQNIFYKVLYSTNELRKSKKKFQNLINAFKVLFFCQYVL